MTKGNRPASVSKNRKSSENQGIGISKVLTVLTAQASSESVPDQKSTKKSNRKTSAGVRNSISVSGLGKKKRLNCSSNNQQKSNHSAPQLSVLQHKLSSNLAILVPLLKRSCPNNLLQIESLQNNEQNTSPAPEKTGSSIELRSSYPSETRSGEVPVSSSKSQGTEKRKGKKKQSTSIVGIISSSNLLPRKSKRVGIQRNHSSPSLITSTTSQEPNKRSRQLPCSRSLASEFPEVVQYYEDAISRVELAKRNISYPVKTSAQRPLDGNTTSAIRTKPSLISFQHKRKNCYSPYSKVSSSSSSTVSAPNTPPTLKNISVKLQQPHPPTLRHHLFTHTTGWGASPRGVTSVPISGNYRGFVSYGPSSESEGTGAVSAGSDPTLHSTSNNAQERNSGNLKSIDADTLTLIASIEKAMNVKNQQQSMMANGKKPQYPPAGRPTGRMQNHFSSSFCLPYGLGNRVQSSPVTTSPVQNSSSFHCGPLESLQLMSEHHQRNSRQQPQFNGSLMQQRKYLERQKMKMLKPLSVTKNQGNITKLYDIPTSEFSAAILPDTGTTSYRLTHDVSFDEGSRYRTTGDYPHSLKKVEESRGSHATNNTLSSHFGSGISARANGSLGPTLQMRHHEGRSSGKDQMSGMKETVPISLIRLEERFGADLPPAASPSSPAMSSTIAATSTASNFIPPPSASRQQNPSSTMTSGSNSITTFRFHKEKHNWNYRIGELSISGGGYYNSTAMSSATRPEMNSINSLNVTSISSTNQRTVQTRERTTLGSKSRMSSRYSSKSENGNSTCSFSDPCIAAPPSFQQRLTDLSILESETIKYERNRKLRRKKNQDKDS